MILAVSQIFVVHEIMNTVKPVLSGHSNIEKTNGSLMKVESIVECSLPLEHSAAIL